MKKLLIVAVATLMVVVANADKSQGKNISAKRQIFRERRIAEAGGLVSRPNNSKPVMIVNDQSRIKEKDFFFDQPTSIEGLLNYPVKIVPPKTDVSGAALVITLSDNTTAPALLIAPELPWAGINVAALAVDKPDEKVLVSRLQKEIWRAFLYACGAANSAMQPCVMRTIRKAADLDVHRNLVPAPDVLQRVIKAASQIGLNADTVCTYRQACEEGWATAPTNDLQKAVWDRVHEVPTKPIRIEYDEKRDKGK